MQNIEPWIFRSLPRCVVDPYATAGGMNLEIVESSFFSLGFDTKSGCLTQIRNKATGNELLAGREHSGNVFKIYFDFDRTFDISGADGRTPEDADLPGEISRAAFSPASGTAEFSRLQGADGDGLTIIYADQATDLRAIISVVLHNERPAALWSLKLSNGGKEPRSVMSSFPIFSGLSLGTGKNNLMVVNDQAGYVLPLWSSEGGIYGNAGQMSMQWGCVFDEESRDAFGFIIKDPDLKNKQIRYHEPSVEVSYFPEVVLEQGQTIAFPDFEMLIYEGDWKPAARQYSAWLSDNFPPLSHGGWIRSVDAHCGAWFEERGTAKPERYPRVVVPLDSFTDLPDVYRHIPADIHEFAFHCSRSMPEDVTGKPMLWTDADNVLRTDLGGATGLKKGVELIHEMGYRFSFYIEGYLCPGDAHIVVQGNAADWTVMNKDGTNNGNYTDEGREIGSGLLHMCPGAVGWQNHLSETAARLVRETGADGVRLDSLGFYFFPCYNPLHGHANPFDFTSWLLELFRKVESAVREVNPDCLLTTEAGADFYGSYFHGALTQQPAPFQVAISRDVSPMRIAAPEYKVYVYDACGPVAASLMGYPGGSPGILSTLGRMKELDRKWRTVRHPVGDIIRWGKAAYDNPEASRPDVVCRRFSSDTMDVIVGARPELPIAQKGTERWKDGVAINSNIDIRADSVEYQISLAGRKSEPAQSLIWDVEDLAVGDLPVASRGDTMSFTVRANWFLAVLFYEGAPGILYSHIPGHAKAGTDIDVASRVLGPGPGESISAILSFPGHGSVEA